MRPEGRLLPWQEPDLQVTAVFRACKIMRVNGLMYFENPIKTLSDSAKSYLTSSLFTLTYYLAKNLPGRCSGCFLCLFANIDVWDRVNQYRCLFFGRGQIPLLMRIGGKSFCGEPDFLTPCLRQNRYSRLLFFKSVVRYHRGISHNGPASILEK